MSCACESIPFFFPYLGLCINLTLDLVKLNCRPVKSDRCSDIKLLVVPICFICKISEDVRDPRQAVKVKVNFESRVYIPTTREAVYPFCADPFSK